MLGQQRGAQTGARRSSNALHHKRSSAALPLQRAPTDPRAPLAPWPSPPSWQCSAEPSGGGGGGETAGGGGDRAALLARIATAKQYKQAGAAPASTSTPTPDGAAAAAATDAAAAAQQAAEMERRRAAWEAELREKERAARGDGSYSALLNQIESGQTNEEDAANTGEPVR